MNIDDLSKFSLGQYGSVSLDSGEQLSLIGSSKYLIGAIHILSNRESSATDNSFQYLIANDLNPLYFGTHYGGSMVLQFAGNNVSSSADTIKVDNGLSYFNGDRNCSVYNEADAVDYVKATHKLGEIEKLFNVPQEIYDSEYGEVGATTLKILRCWIG